MREFLQASFPVLGTVVLAASLPAEVRDPETEHDRTLYALGLALSESVSRFDLTTAELERVVEGLRDGVAEEARVSLDRYREGIDALVKERLDAAYRAQERLGAAFRSDVLATHRDATVLASGGIAIPVREGSGPKPDPSAAVRIAYTGSVADGTVFDRAPPGAPLTVGVADAVLPCLEEGLRRMREGAVYRFVCPPVRGFAHPRVKAGSTLIYDIELIEILEASR